MRKAITIFTMLALVFCLQLFIGSDAFAAFETFSSESGGATMHGLETLWNFTGFANVELGNIIMIAVGLFFIFLAIKYDYEPLLLIPIGTGILLGNVPFVEGYKIGLYEEGSVLNYLYFGVEQGIYPPLIFLGIGAMDRLFFFNFQS